MPADFLAVTMTSEASEPSLTTDMGRTAVVPGASASIASGADVGRVEIATDPARIMESGHLHLRGEVRTCRSHGECRAALRQWRTELS